MSFKIVVDSCCDLSPQMKKEPCFVRVPMTIQVDGSVFVDDETFDQADLLWAMQQSENAPSTSCPSPQSYLDAYQGEEEDVYVVTLSALLIYHLRKRNSCNEENGRIQIFKGNRQYRITTITQAS